MNLIEITRWELDILSDGCFDTSVPLKTGAYYVGNDIMGDSIETALIPADQAMVSPGDNVWAAWFHGECVLCEPVYDFSDTYEDLSYRLWAVDSPGIRATMRIVWENCHHLETERELRRAEEAKWYAEHPSQPPEMG